jgi:hypothetical protein
LSKVGNGSEHLLVNAWTSGLMSIALSSDRHQPNNSDACARGAQEMIGAV